MTAEVCVCHVCVHWLVMETSSQLNKIIKQWGKNCKTITSGGAYAVVRGYTGVLMVWWCGGVW